MVARLAMVDGTDPPLDRETALCADRRGGPAGYGTILTVRATGTPEAIERAERMFRLLQDASHLATEPVSSRKAWPKNDAQEWSDLLARFDEEREAFLKTAREYLGADRP
jgi:hypothetical protein